MDGKLKPRPSRFEKTINDILVAANGCLAVTAILLAGLMFIQLQVVSWSVDDDSARLPSRIELGLVRP